MYKKVELPNGFVGLEKEVANLWSARNVIKKNFDIKVFLAFQRVIHEEQLADKWAIQRLKVRITEEDMK